MGLSCLLSQLIKRAMQHLEIWISNLWQKPVTFSQYASNFMFSTEPQSPLLWAQEITYHYHHCHEFKRHVPLSPRSRAQETCTTIITVTSSRDMYQREYVPLSPLPWNQETMYHHHHCHETKRLCTIVAVTSPRDQVPLSHSHKCNGICTNITCHI